MDSIRRNLLVLLVALTMLPATLVAEPRGYRNHNPGNIVATDIPWRGKTPCTNGETVHECFENDYYGLRAMALTLRSYMTTHGLVTIRGIMGRFSEFAGAGDAVARISGMDIDRELDLHDLDTMVTLMQAIVIQENGYTKYDSADIAGVLYDSYGVDHFARQHANGRHTEVCRGKAAGGARAPQYDDAGAGCSDGGAKRDSLDRQRGVRVDSQGDCPTGSDFDRSVAESSGHSVSVPTSDGWLDRVDSWLLALQRRIGTAYVARCEGAGYHSSGYPPSGGNCWTLFWW